MQVGGIKERVGQKNEVIWIPLCSGILIDQSEGRTASVNKIENR